MAVESSEDEGGFSCFCWTPALKSPRTWVGGWWGNRLCPQVGKISISECWTLSDAKTLGGCYRWLTIPPKKNGDRVMWKTCRKLEKLCWNLDAWMRKCMHLCLHVGTCPHRRLYLLVAQSHPALCDPWTVARQAPLSMGFSRYEHWSGLPCPSPRAYTCLCECMCLARVIMYACVCV